MPDRTKAGLRKGTPVFEYWPVAAASADIEVYDLITLSSGYAAQCSAGDTVAAFAHSKVSSPSANGDVVVKVDVSKETVYEYPIDTGTVAESNRGGTGDSGGSQSVDVTSTTNNDIAIVNVDTDANTFRIKRA